ncbi:hypothetical protein SFA71_10180 [Legionella pneumophila subsp. fraseri]|nr:hypothetical protein [Legionella pneumophila subsp. fraseri]HCU6009588.1 hypothetical protein [Legionella pneumophila]MDW9039265.1 hypothetical protein [Legionella pneumophila subsp. fraseri]MDW9042113.1 hypothetical protein [Legionella pneumophila subsp. fraseri]MDW9064008.1 hypothetical protein [Legionella pneumophila subsp. fraseri]
MQKRAEDRPKSKRFSVMEKIGTIVLWRKPAHLVLVNIARDEQNFFKETSK